jgi:uncharacterized repeat protein (TIGR02543 family)
MKYLLKVMFFCIFLWLLSGCNDQSDLTLPSDPTTPIDQITIYFETNGGEPIFPLLLTESVLTETLPTPTKEGHQFIGWFLNIELTTTSNQISLVSESITLYAKWEIKSYQITFEMRGHGNQDPLTLPFGSIIEIPTPIYQGFSFEGWFYDEDFLLPFEETTMPALNLTLYPRWQYLFQMRLANLGDMEDIISYHKPGTPLIEPEIPVRDHLIFMGWYDGFGADTLFEFGNMPDKYLYLIADWMTPGLLFELTEDQLGYEVSVGDAITEDHVFIPRNYMGKPVIKIADYGFRDAEMSHIDLPTTLIEIGNFAFLDAYLLERIVMYWRVNKIGNSVFRSCYALNEIDMFGSSENYTAVDGILYTSDYKTLVRYPIGKTNIKDYVLPDYVETIEADAFSEVSLTSFTFGSGIKTIKTHAFYRTKDIEHLSIPDHVTTIEFYAFREFTSLKTITLGSGITEISSYVFDSCVSLESITIPFSVIFIGYGAFYFCSNLNNVYILRSSTDSLIGGSLFMFANTPSSMKINFIDNTTLELYKIAYHWSSYASKMQVNPT